MKLTGIVKDKVLDKVVLNLFGIQIFRILLARIILIINRFFLKNATDDHVKILLKDGIVIIPDFLDDKDFEKVREEYYQATQNDNFIQNYQITRPGVDKCTFSRNSIPYWTKITLLDNTKVKMLFTWGEARTISFNNCSFELCTYNTKGDVQQEFHRDNFYSTHKAFFYIEDVHVTDGPFCYVRGSNKITLFRLLHEYINGLSRYRTKTLRPNQSNNKIIKWIENILNPENFQPLQAEIR